jgi:CRISPR/Cas system-associated exonuclease Cas4 (RecB family)
VTEGKRRLVAYFGERGGVVDETERFAGIRFSEIFSTSGISYRGIQWARSDDLLPNVLSTNSEGLTPIMFGNVVHQIVWSSRKNVTRGIVSKRYRLIYLSFRHQIIEHIILKDDGRFVVDIKHQIHIR